MRQLLSAVLALGVCLPATAQVSLNAQYQWVDQSGQMVFSDRPPPANVPLSRILRVGDPVAGTTRPTQQGQSEVIPVPPERLSPPAPRLPQPANEPAGYTLSEQMAAFEKRRAERKAKHRKREDQARLVKANAKSCERMRAEKEKLDSGMRVRSRDKTGAVVFLTESERFAQAKALAKRLKKCPA